MKNGINMHPKYVFIDQKEAKLYHLAHCFDRFDSNHPTLFSNSAHIKKNIYPTFIQSTPNVILLKLPKHTPNNTRNTPTKREKGNEKEKKETPSKSVTE